MSPESLSYTFARFMVLGGGTSFCARKPCRAEMVCNIWRPAFTKVFTFLTLALFSVCLSLSLSLSLYFLMRLCIRNR